MITKRPAIQFSPETQDSFDIVANHDVKAVAYATLVDEGSFLTTGGLAKAVESRAGFPVPSVKSYPLTFEDKGFASSEVVGRHRGKDARGYGAERVEHALAAVGAMMEWSEQHDFPILAALSSTASQGSRAPINTIQILESLLNGVYGINRIAESRYKRHRTGAATEYNSRFKKMLENGLVVAEPHEVRAKIIDPQYRAKRELSSGQTALYTLLKQAKTEQPAHPWTADELVAFALENGIVAEADVSDMRERVIRVLSSNNPRYSPGATETGDIGHMSFRYRISQSFQEPAADLVERVKTVDTSSRGRKAYRDTAIDIINDQSTVGRVIKRGQEHSPYRKN